MTAGQPEALPAATGHPRTDALARTLPLVSERAFWILIAVSVALGAAVRAFHVLSSDFPLNDGGLFYAMARDLQQHAFHLPAFTTYNNAQIPFAYSPLGFYAAAVLDRLTPLSLMDQFRLLPFVYSVGSLVAFALLARRLLPAQSAAIAATFAFALIPRSFIWLIMGGGVARGLGLLCALLALHEVHRLYVERRPRFILSTGVLYAATVLAHVETGWFLSFSIVIFWLTYGRSRRTFAYSVAVAAMGAVLTAPWWLTVALAHGVRPFIEANASGGNVFASSRFARETFLSIARITSTSEPLFPLIGALGLLGGLAALRSRQVMLPLWWVAIIVLDLRAYPTFTTIPVALLAGLALSHVLLPLAHLVWDRPLLPGARSLSTSPLRHVSRGAALVTAALLLYTVSGSLLRTPGLAGEASYLVGLTHGERTAMQWLRTNTPADATVLVVPRGPWQVDKESEWFPVLTGRTSVATVQGTEWTRNFQARVEAYDDAWDCGYRLSDCLVAWSNNTRITFSYVWVPWTEHGQCCSTLLASLRGDRAYRLVYDGPGGTIFATGRTPGAGVAVRLGIPSHVPVPAFLSDLHDVSSRLYYNGPHAPV